MLTQWIALVGRSLVFIKPEKQAQLRAVAFKACIRHPSLRLRVFHKSLPHEGGTHIFSHEHGDSGVNADDVSVIPIFQWIESVDEAVAVPGLRVTISDIFEDPHRGLRQKWQ